ncbi:MAG: class I SAM-dependent methyltransferase [Desulfatibacillaceae bacterium]
MLTVDFKKIGLFPGQKLLDVGCGEGRHTCHAYTREGVFTVGLDLDYPSAQKTRDMLRAMEEEGMGGGGKWQVVCGDSTRLPFADQSFDAVICSEVLEHIPDNAGAAGELARVLKDTGMLAVSVPRYFPERICWALSDEYHSNEGGHIRIYRKKELRRLFESAGLKCVGSHGAHALHAPYWWIKCAVGVENEKALPVKLYHRMLVWDIMRRPLLTRAIEKALNPWMGKSVVMYFVKSVVRKQSYRATARNSPSPFTS